MVVIRLARFGKKHYPIYRVTVADSRKAATGKFIEVLGTYNPTPRGKDQKLTLDMDKVSAWIKQGAQPTDRVKSLIRQLTGEKAKPSKAKVSKPKPKHVPPAPKA